MSKFNKNDIVAPPNDMSKMSGRTKGWLTPVGKTWWIDTLNVHGHAGAVPFFLKDIDPKTDMVEMYDAMFAQGFVRVQIEGYNLFFNKGMRDLSFRQKKWLHDFAISNHYVVVDGDNNREMNLESATYEFFEADETLSESYLSNKGNSDFQTVIKSITRGL